MKANLKYAMIALIGVGLAAGLQTEAFAWGCYAQARDGTYGYSYNYPNKRSAAARALAECSVRTYRRCRVVYCKPNG